MRQHKNISVAFATDFFTRCRVEGFGFSRLNEEMLQILTDDVLKSSEIEGDGLRSEPALRSRPYGDDCLPKLEDSPVDDLCPI
jgi:hypothetical protein